MSKTGQTYLSNGKTSCFSAGLSNEKTSFRSEGSFSCRGKAFLLGEYSVLFGGQAVVASVGPKFELVPDSEHVLSFPAGSQAHALLGDRKLHMRFIDPIGGAGGIGASSAQFLLAARALELGQDPMALWKEYRKFSREPLPSGADLVAQAYGGVVGFNPEKCEVKQMFDLLDWSGVYVFLATKQKDRKVVTHEHLNQLENLSGPKLSKLSEIVEFGMRAIESGSMRALGKSMTAYAQALAEIGLECPESHRDSKFFSDIPGVLGAKGSGAMLADLIVVAADRSELDETEFLAQAQSRGLEYLGHPVL